MTSVSELSGLVLRRHGGGTAIAALLAPIANAVNAFDGVDELVSVSELENWLSHRTVEFDPGADLVLAEVDGALVGYGWVEQVETTDGLHEFRLGGYVHPEWQQRGIGRRLLAGLEARAAERPVPDGRPRVVGTWAPELRVRKRRLLERTGYEIVRHFFLMRRDLEAPIEVPSMPDGLEVRPIGLDRESQLRWWAADAEAFQDHWGGFDASEAAFERAIAGEDHQPGLWVVAWDGDEIAGAVTNAIPAAENEAYARRRGWLETVFVRRAWRRRGLGAAIVARALVRLREAGMSEGMLGVDSDNPTGALGLYERAGFTVHRRAAAYRKPMEARR